MVLKVMAVTCALILFSSQSPAAASIWNVFISVSINKLKYINTQPGKIKNERWGHQNNSSSCYFFLLFWFFFFFFFNIFVFPFLYVFLFTLPNIFPHLILVFSIPYLYCIISSSGVSWRGFEPWCVLLMWLWQRRLIHCATRPCVNLIKT